jgi:transcriptional regulator with XRE-family HTH domain
VAQRWAQRRFQLEVRDLLDQRGLSVRQLAVQAGVSASYLSRLLRRVEYKHRPSAELAERIASALNLPKDYFIEYREHVIYDRIRKDPVMRDRIYRMIKRTTSDG